MNDSRQCLLSLFTSSLDGFIPGMQGSTLANYCELKEFKKDKDGKIVGAVLEDKLTKKELHVKAKVFVNCAGVHADKIRKMANEESQDRILSARGAHLLFDKKYLGDHEGVVVP